jgi:hypothetical protein
MDDLGDGEAELIIWVHINFVRVHGSQGEAKAVCDDTGCVNEHGQLTTFRLRSVMVQRNVYKGLGKFPVFYYPCAGCAVIQSKVGTFQFQQVAPARYHLLVESWLRRKQCESPDIVE